MSSFLILNVAHDGFFAKYFDKIITYKHKNNKHGAIKFIGRDPV